MTEKQPELLPAPKGERVLATLRTYRVEIFDQLNKGKETIAKKKEEVEFLEKELARIDAAVKIVKEDLMTPAAPAPEKPKKKV
jgi:hypothetical protein